jgi:hypothetical protein
VWSGEEISRPAFAVSAASIRAPGCFQNVAREGLDMARLHPTQPAVGARAAGVLELDAAGRAAACRHIEQGKHGAVLMPTPNGLFDSWATRPRFAP